MKLSIIVPVYGVEKYIECCISSLLIPSCEEYEIVIVNDGTKDSSIDIVRKMFKDPRIRIIEQENAGPSAARNNGIQNSKGEYIWFFDSDDWAESQHILPIIKELEDIDALYIPYYFKNYDNDGKEIIEGKKSFMTSGKDLACSDTPQCPPYYIWKKDILVKNELYFKEGILHEDALFTPVALMYMNRIKEYDTPVYHHRMREGSTTHVINPKRINDLVYVSEELIKIAETGISNEIKYKWGQCIANVVNEALYIAQDCTDKKTKNMLKENVNRNWTVFKYLIHSRKRYTQALGVLAFLFLGDIYTLYSILYRIRYK